MKNKNFLFILIILLAINLSYPFHPVNAQEQTTFKPQQLILTPIGKGSYTQLVDIEGISGPYFSENWQYIVSTDSRYLRADSQEATDTYKLSNHDPLKNYGSIYSIDITVTYSSIGQRQGFSGAVYINDNLYTTDKQEITSISDGDMHFILAKNPITEKPWTWSDIDNLEAGATLYRSSLTSSSPYLDKLSVIVNYGLDITIITDPIGCNVSLDGTTIISDSNGSIFTGITPFTIWNVTVSKQFYNPKTETISINNTNVQTTISLTQAYYKLTILTNPENRKVFIDGVEQSTGWFPENTQHKVEVIGDFYYDSKEEIVTVGNQDVALQLTLSQSIVPYILFGIIGLIIILTILFLIKYRKKIAGWDEERKRNILFILLIAINIVLFLTLYFLSGIIGLAIALLNVLGIIFVTYTYFNLNTYGQIGIIAIFCQGVITVLYALVGSFWGPATLVIIDIAVFIIAILPSISSGSTAVSKTTTSGGYSQGPVREPKTCVLCGRPLRSRRKYCSICVPWGTRPPREENESIFSSFVESNERPYREPRSSPRERDYFGGNKQKSYEDYVGNQKNLTKI